MITEIGNTFHNDLNVTKMVKLFVLALLSIFSVIFWIIPYMVLFIISNTDFPNTQKNLHSAIDIQIEWHRVPTPVDSFENICEFDLVHSQTGIVVVW